MARLEIKEALTAPDAEVTRAVEAPRRSRERVAWAAGCVMAAAAAGLAVWILNPVSQHASPQVSRVLVGVAPADQLAPTGPTVARPSRTAMALSPDGKYLVFSATRAGTQQLYLRAMDRLEATPIAGTEGSSSPFFSPDGQWVGFWQGVLVPPDTGELKKVPLSGGPAVTLCKTAALSGASWGSNDTIVFSNSSPGGGVWRVSAAGGMPQQLTTAEANKGEVSHRLPQMLPGGDAVLFTIQKAVRRWDDAQIVVRSLVTGEQKVLVEGGADARYVPTGHLVYARSGTLMAVPFDLARLAVTGNPNGIVDGVMQDVNSTLAGGDTGAAQFSVSGAGALVYLPGGIFPDAERSLVWVDRNGAAEPLPGPPRNFAHPRLSPDGQRLAFDTTGTVRNVWIREISRGTSSRLTTEGQNSNPIWTPDGKRLTFTSATAGPQNLFWKSADGSGAAERLATDEQVQFPSSWSPDGKALALIQYATVTAPNADIWIVSLEDGTAKPRPFLQTPFLEPGGGNVAMSSVVEVPRCSMTAKSQSSPS